MVSTVLYNRSEITERIDTLFSCIEKQKWRDAKIASDGLLHSLLKYYKTRGISANHFYELFEDLNFDIVHCLSGQSKKQIVLDKLDVIIKEIKTSTKDPILRIKEILDDIRHLFFNIDKKVINELIGCFDELSELQEEMNEIGGTVYNFYTQMMQKLGDCESTMLRVNQTTKSDSLYNSLDAKFSAFFQAANKVIHPPITLEISKEQLYKAFKDKTSLEDIAEGTAQSDESLRALLQSAEMDDIEE